MRKKHIASSNLRFFTDEHLQYMQDYSYPARKEIEESQHKAGG